MGALGPVFRTYEPARDRLVAVKVFRLDVTPEQAKALADELSRAAEASLFHPSIVEPIAAGIEGASAYRAEEYVAAESLDVAMRHYAPATLEKALPFITQLAGAIDFARAAGVGHGALHPRDIFMTPDEARATGFGVVEALERTGLRAPVRRPYTAPERIAGGAWTTTADVFSLAAIAYELLTGRRPAGTGDGIGSIGDADVSRHSDLLQQVLARAMHEDPAKRYPTALGFASALEAAGRGEPLAASPPEVRDQARTTAVEPDAAGAAIEPFPLPPESLGLGSAPAAATPAEPPPEFSPDDVDLVRADSGVSAADAHDAIRDVSPTPVDKEDEVPLRPPASVAERAFVDEPASAIEPPSPAGRALAGDTDESGFRILPRFSAIEAKRATGDENVRVDAGVPGNETLFPVDEDEPRVSSRPAAAQSASVTEADAFRGHERSRLAVLPLALTLIFGLLLGFAAGYAVGGRDRGVASGGQPSQAAQTAAEGQPAGREWSEQAVKPPAAAAQQPSRVAPPVPQEGPGARAEKPPARPAASPAPALPTSGTLIVRSAPSGAAVTINGRWRGRTPLTLDGLPFARYVVRVIQPGYAVAREEIALSRSNASQTMSLALRPERSTARGAEGGPGSSPAARQAQRRGSAPAASGAASAPVRAYFGSIYVASNPPGARVFLDGKPMGTAPVRIPEVPIGSHVVRMELPDHRTWTAATSVVAGQDVRVTGSLERIQ